MSTNSGAAALAFQGWRNFKEAFAPELVQIAAEETMANLGRRVGTIVDPFGGSGTTALAAQFLGCRPTTVEVNPYLADLIEAKLALYDARALLDGFKTVTARKSGRKKHFQGAPATFVEPGVNNRYLFSTGAAQSLLSLRAAIDELNDEPTRRLFRVLLGSVAIDTSNVVVSGKGRRYRKNWEARVSSSRTVRELFEERALQAIYDIERYGRRPETNYTLLRGDARLLTKDVGSSDLAIFSPPYPNSFDYTDVYNVELWVCGYLTGSEDNKRLRQSTLRSHVQIKRDLTSSSRPTKTLQGVLNRLEDALPLLWDADLPQMVSAYFDDLRLILRDLQSNLVVGGRAYVVVGDSQYAHITVPVAKILGEIARDLGYDVVRSSPFRSMRASPQQGGKERLAETMLVFRT